MDWVSEYPYVIAEIGGNHEGDIETAKRMVRAVAESGADAAKFQYYDADLLIDSETPAVPILQDEYETQHDRFAELEFTESEWDELVATAETAGIDFAASVSPFIKIASGDVTNVPLLRHVASLDKPVVLSTGFATIDEIRRAVEELDVPELVLLHCMGSYPTPDEAANLQLIDQLMLEFDVHVGYSDHTVGMLAPLTAVARGAGVIEKHFTLDKSREVGDHRLSATPEELSTFVSRASRVWQMFGDGDRTRVFDAETTIRRRMRRSLATRTAVSEGDRFTAETVAALRPEDGISPQRYDEVVGAVATRDIPALEFLSEDDFEDR
jgi:sialic acid synthase SpsE